VSRTYRWSRKPHNQLKNAWLSNCVWWRNHFWRDIGGHSVEESKAARTEQHRQLRHKNKINIHKGRDVEKHPKI
jgi:hypothetical protein